MLSNCSQCKYYDNNPHHSKDIRCAIAPAYTAMWERLQGLDVFTLQSVPVASCLDFDVNEALLPKKINLALNIQQWQGLTKTLEDRTAIESINNKLVEHSLSLTLEEWQAIADSTLDQIILTALASAGIEPRDLWIEVNSSCIKAISHLRSQSILLIKFHSHRVYEYQAVSSDIYEEFLDSSSKGTFFNNHIKDYFAYREVDS